MSVDSVTGFDPSALDGASIFSNPFNFTDTSIADSVESFDPTTVPDAGSIPSYPTTLTMWNGGSSDMLQPPVDPVTRYTFSNEAAIPTGADDTVNIANNPTPTVGDASSGVVGKLQSLWGAFQTTPDAKSGGTGTAQNTANSSNPTAAPSSTSNAASPFSGFGHALGDVLGIVGSARSLLSGPGARGQVQGIANSSTNLAARPQPVAAQPAQATQSQNQNSLAMMVIAALVGIVVTKLVG